VDCVAGQNVNNRDSFDYVLRHQKGNTIGDNGGFRPGASFPVSTRTLNSVWARRQEFTGALLQGIRQYCKIARKSPGNRPEKKFQQHTRVVTHQHTTHRSIQAVFISQCHIHHPGPIFGSQTSISSRNLHQWTVPKPQPRLSSLTSREPAILQPTGHSPPSSTFYIFAVFPFTPQSSRV
jgi:hypothetical protein